MAKFVHPRSREAHLQVGRETRKRRIESQEAAHRAEVRQPVLAQLKYFQARARESREQDPSKLSYGLEELRELTADFLLNQLETNIASMAQDCLEMARERRSRVPAHAAAKQTQKSSIEFVSRRKAFEMDLQLARQGLYKVPNLQDEFTVVSLLSWEGGMQGAGSVSRIVLPGGIAEEKAATISTRLAELLR